VSNPLILPYILILTAGSIWGSTFSLALIATADGTHPLVLTTWQVTLSVVIISGVCLYSSVPVFRIKHLRQYCVVGTIGIVVPDILYYTAAPHLSAGILSITVSTVPLFTYLFMWVLRFEKLVVKRAFGIVLGMAAILLLVLPDHGLSSEDANFWILLVVICAVLYAAQNVYISEWVTDDLDIRELLCGSTMVSVLFLIPATALLGYSIPVSWVFSQAGWAITALAVLSVTAYLIYFHTIKIAGPVFASQCAYVVTVSGVLWGIAIFSEQHSFWVWLSVFVLMAGLALVSPSQRGSILKPAPLPDSA
jgi:drug/metabolite transporter (DMT)-like permease